MLSINTLVAFVLDLEGVISEPIRSEIAHRMANLIADAIKDTNLEAYQHWVSEGRLKFIRCCRLSNLEHWVPDDLIIKPTKLAEFCNRWMSCNLFKLRNDPKADWKPINPEMNGLRVTMVEELKALSDG